jgi:N-acyl-D-amino-acid deacylase
MKQFSAELLKAQQVDGGWSQLDGMESDPYATATVLVGLIRSGQTDRQQPAYANGISYLVKHQTAQGSWHVKSRSKPFQKYFETGFPHKKDQFISTSATAWATIALLLALPSNEAGDTLEEEKFKTDSDKTD